MMDRYLTARERTSRTGLRLLFVGYAAFAGIYGLYWVHMTAMSAENSCNSAIKQGDAGAAVIIGFLAAGVVILCSYLAVRVPARWWQLLLAILAVATVTWIGYAYVAAANIDWCTAGPGFGF